MVTQWFHRTEEYPVFFFVQLSDPVDSVRVCNGAALGPKLSFRLLLLAS